jgi:DNA/RNA-binding domain of Phe-tRNA-synthetase-like protein
MRLVFEIEHDDLLLGLVEADGIRMGPSSEGLLAEMAAASATRVDEGARTAVRDLLRAKGFKPSGRSKPASEYLAGVVAKEGRLPSVANVVDVNNLVSLESGLPISVVDAGRLGGELVVRVGAAGERFAFNRGEGFVQEIEVEGLIVLARPGGAAVGSPVKDGVEAKLDEGSTSVAAVIYGTRKVLDDAAMGRWCDRYAQLLKSHLSPSRCDVRVIPAAR